jgi:hypothetical protein
MAYFTLVINEVSPENFERLVEVQTKAAKEVKFRPQGGGQQAPSMVGSPNMVTDPQTGVINHLRYEWGDAGIEAAIKLLHVFHKHQESAEAARQ